MTQPWSNQAVSLIVLQATPGTFTGLFVYSGAPAAGNLIASIAPAAGTDPYTNAYLAGVASYGSTFEGELLSGILQWFNKSSPAATPPRVQGQPSAGGNVLDLESGTGAGGSISATLQLLDSLNTGTVPEIFVPTPTAITTDSFIWVLNSSPPAGQAASSRIYSAGGHLKYSSPAAPYNTGRNTQPSNAPLTLTTSFQNIPNIGAQVEAGITYHYRAQVLINNPGTAGQGAIGVQVAGGPTLANGRYSAKEVVANGTVWEDYTTINSAINSPNAPSTVTNNRVWDLDAIFDCTASGFFTFQMKQLATAACNTLQNGTYGELFPVT